MTAPYIVVAYASFGDTGILPEPTISALPAALKRRLQGMQNSRARAHSLTGYWLLERGAALAGWPQLALDTLIEDENGRPGIIDGPDFNISHSRGMVACAIGVGCRVGMDVERIRPVDTQKLRRFLSDENASECRTEPAAFFEDWAAREASVKAGGRIGLARIARVQLGRSQSQIDDETWHLQYPALISSVAACLACDRPGVTVQIQDFSKSLMKYSAA